MSDPTSSASSESSSSSAEPEPTLPIVDYGESSTSSEEGSSSYSAPEATQSPYDFARSLIAAIVACINTHCNQAGSEDADAKIAALKAQFATDRDAAGTANNRFAAEGDPFTLLEQDHLDYIFALLKRQPSLPNPVLAAPLIQKHPVLEPTPANHQQSPLDPFYPAPVMPTPGVPQPNVPTVQQAV